MAKYDEWLTPDGLLQLEAWARDGLTYEQIASNCGIALSTLKDWREQADAEREQVPIRGGHLTIHIKTCPTCGKVIGINQRHCALCEAAREGRVSPRQKQYDKKRDPEEVKFRRSRQWRMTRDYIIQRDGYLCQECRKRGRYTIASEVHHIVPLWKDFDRRLDDDNLISLCHRCHMRLEPPRPGEVDR